MSFEDLNHESEVLQRLLQKHQTLLETNCLVEAEAIASEIFSCFVQKSSYELDLTSSAIENEENAEWCHAEAKYFEILSVPDIEPAARYKANTSLARLCLLQGRFLDALSHSRNGTTAARVAGIPFLLSMALVFEAQCMLKSNRVDEGRLCLAEALSLITTEGVFNQLRARILIVRAECELSNGDLERCQRDLETSFDLIGHLRNMENAAGIQNDLALWWSVTARLRGRLRDRDSAIEQE